MMEVKLWKKWRKVLLTIKEVSSAFDVANTIPVFDKIPIEEPDFLIASIAFSTYSSLPC